MCRPMKCGAAGWAACLLLMGCLNGPARATERVQDVAKLQGQRTNHLFGFGLVVGLNGTGDGASSAATIRALMALHKRYHQPILDGVELKNNKNVAIVTVEATIPEFGGREGQQMDVTVSAIGPAASLKGGQLLTTPLQESTLAIDDVLALAGGRIDLPDAESLRRGIIRQGATIEEDLFYNFLEDGCVWLVLDEGRSGYQWAEVIARSINLELANPAERAAAGRAMARQIVAAQGPAVAVDPRNVRIRIPDYELNDPAEFISRVLQTPLFVTPHEPALVCINRTTRKVSFRGAVTIAPTILHLPGVGALSVGHTGAAAAPTSAPSTESAVSGDAIEFQQLMDMLARLQLAPEEVISAVEHLHQSGALRARLVYVE